MHAIVPSSSPSSILFSSLHQDKFPILRPSPRRSRMVGFASQGNANGPDSSGRMVDENMVVLRKRIHETKMAEKGIELPSYWMQWEKEYYENYGSDVCEIVGLLQVFLMNTRPSVAIGLVMLLMMSVPTSVILILVQLIMR